MKRPRNHPSSPLRSRPHRKRTPPPLVPPPTRRPPHLIPRLRRHWRFPLGNFRIPPLRRKRIARITAESASVITETKQILIDYAISPPPAALEDVADCGLQAVSGCYNYYNSNQSAYVKYTPFTLPCPDLTLDGNLDGAQRPRHLRMFRPNRRLLTILHRNPTRTRSHPQPPLWTNALA